ncbi:hypothetical protein ACF07D_04645 [Leucobacter sp. NPDC015123]|uniref:hypothetical protein n=1 Tax=Leucobacter sp. NPDC015123 TaxID=3364129 RepID=UPI0036F46596
MGIAPSRLWGSEPARRIVQRGEEWVVEQEPEISKEDYELLAALYEYEASVDTHGFPLEESMSILADPLNPEGTHRYEARPVRNWADDALEQAEKDPRYSGENYSSARKWRVYKVDR